MLVRIAVDIVAGAFTIVVIVIVLCIVFLVYYLK